MADSGEQLMELPSSIKDGKFLRISLRRNKSYGVYYIHLCTIYLFCNCNISCIHDVNIS